MKRGDSVMDLSLSGQTGERSITLLYESSINIADLLSFPAYTVLLRKETGGDEIEPNLVFKTERF